MSLTLEDLRGICQRCDGSGSIESSNHEDARFSYQDQCPECSSFGAVPVTEVELLVLAVEHLKAKGAREVDVPDWDGSGWHHTPLRSPGRYLLIPVEALEEQ